MRVRRVRCQVSGQRGGEAAFTIIEVALCLAIIGFALIAIIGVLPAGLTVQRDNREETIINQEATVWMSAIRHGAGGSGDLTNYVLAITNYWGQYTYGAGVTNQVATGIDGYDHLNSSVTSVGGAPAILLNSASNIIGLLSTPKYTMGSNFFQSNYVIAYVRSASGAAVDKYPQTNDTVLADAFTYKLIVEILPYVKFDPSSTNYTDPLITNDVSAVVARSNYFAVVQRLQTNSYDFRLTFRWPLLPDGSFGIQRQTFRIFTGGAIVESNVVARASLNAPFLSLYYFQPSTYVQVQP